ncbi:MAG: hypothetical protein EBT50_06265 [Verrucomicrobia bacterium]|nr:hypothetical protein [Verrucomicrobiota bacterium]
MQNNVMMFLNFDQLLPIMWLHLPSHLIDILPLYYISLDIFLIHFLSQSTQVLNLGHPFLLDILLKQIAMLDLSFLPDILSLKIVPVVLNLQLDILWL